MNKKTGFIIAGIVIVFGALLGVSFLQKRPQQEQETDYGQYRLEVITDLASKNDYKGLDPHSVLPAMDASGNLPENINGDKDALVKIYEYADYPCGYCGMMNPILNEIVEDYDGKVAVVFRSYILLYHEKNGMPAASAANAAAIQGHWKKYKDLLFENQDDWFYSTGADLQEQLEKYFEEASDGKGDLEKFREDMKSEAVAKKIAFDYGIGNKLEIGGTPWIYIAGEWVENKGSDGKGLSPAEYGKKIRAVIDEQLSH